jgi:hypothetical protein
MRLEKINIKEVNPLIKGLLEIFWSSININMKVE